MELAAYLLEAATDILREEGTKGLPRQLAGTPFWLSRAQDRRVMAFGAIKFDGHLYKVGTSLLDGAPCKGPVVQGEPATWQR